MNEVFVDLTSVAMLCILDGISEHLRPIITYSLDSIAKLRAFLMGPTRAIAGFLSGLLRFFDREVTEK